MTWGNWLLIALWGVMAVAVIREPMKKRSDKAPLGTLDDPAVAYMAVKQKAMGKRLRRQGRSLLTGKPYTPVLTMPAEAQEQTQRQLYVVRGGKR